MAYIPLRKAVEFLGLHPNTLRKYADEGQIESLKNEAGQHLYNVESARRDAVRSTVVCYCRVSSTPEPDDWQRQADFIQERYPEAEIIQDIGSELNFKRKGLQALLVRFLRGAQLAIVVACRDQWCRDLLHRRCANRFELFECMALPNSGRVVVLNQAVHGRETELTAALFSILHIYRFAEAIYSCRMHGLRSYSQKIKEDPFIPKP